MNQSSYDAINFQPNSLSVRHHNTFNFGSDNGKLDVTTRDVDFFQTRVFDTVVTTDNNIVNRESVVGSSVTGSSSVLIPPLADSGEGGDNDPLAQTFFVKPAKGQTLAQGSQSGPGVATIKPATKNPDGVYVTKVDLYFESKDPNQGISVALTSTDNGVPTDNIIPFSEVHLRPEQVNVSDDGSAVTTFTFGGLIFLKANETYAIRILPDGATSNYQVFTHINGLPDLANPSRISNKDLHEGQLYASQNTRNYIALPQEDLKYTLYHAQFNILSGTIKFENANLEFFSCNSFNNKYESGERVFKFGNTTVAGYGTGNVQGNVTFSTTNNEIVGTGTNFGSDGLANGQFILLSNGTSHDAKQITGITNTTHLTVAGFPSFTSSGQAVSGANTYVYNVPIGKCYVHELTDQANVVILTDSSSANATYKFSASDNIIGARSSANAIIETVDDRKIDYFENILYSTEPVGCKIAHSLQSNTATGTSANTSYPTNDRNFLPETLFIKSQSNDPGVKSLSVNFALSSIENKLSPTIDRDFTSLLIFENIINNSNTNEYKPESGNTLAKHVTKTFNLDPNLDSEDFKVFVTHTKPGTSNVEAYARFSSGLDPQDQAEAHWTRLQLDSPNKTTSKLNKKDVAEYEYAVPDTPPTTVLAGVANVSIDDTLVLTSQAINGSNTTTLAVGDLVKITASPASNTDYQIERVTAVNSTSFTLDRPPQFNNVQAQVEKINTEGLRTAFKDPQNSGIITYFNEQTNRITTYDSVQLKFVMLSDNSAIVPEIHDYRALALTI